MLKQRYFFVLLFPIFLVLPLPLNVSALALILAVLNLVVIYFLDDKVKFFKTDLNDPFVILCFLTFLLDLITTILRQNEVELVFRESRLSFLIIPLFFSLFRDYLVELKRDLLRSFVIGVLAYIVFAYVYLTYFYLNLTNRGFELNHYLKYDLATNLPYAYHHTYLGMYFCFAIFILLYSITFQKDPNTKLKFSLALFIFFNQLFMGGKLTIGISALVIGFFFFKYYSERLLNKSLNKILIWPFLLVISGSLFKILLDKRMLTTFENSANFRWQAWKCSINLIQERYFLGWGQQEALSLLNSCTVTGMNGTHNQFLEELLFYGLFGFWLIVFFVILWRKLRINILGKLFVLMLIVVSFSENIFSLQRGILFITFFSSVLYFSSKNYDSGSNSPSYVH